LEKKHRRLRGSKRKRKRIIKERRAGIKRMPMKKT
jgi:hypothetical protein